MGISIPGTKRGSRDLATFTSKKINNCNQVVTTTTITTNKETNKQTKK
jgi:hypothetical protein